MTRLNVGHTTSVTDPVLSVCGLTVRLPNNMERTYAVEDISFDLQRGEILCIIGESGSGKSVTANAIMGLLAPVIRVTSGSILFQGIDLLSADPTTLQGLRGRAVSIIFQDPLSALNPLMTIGDQILEVLETHRVGTPSSQREKLQELLSEVGLPDPVMLQHQYPFRGCGVLLITWTWPSGVIWMWTISQACFAPKYDEFGSRS